MIENAGLTEWPVPLLGRFDPAFLEVPPEVIQLTARVNQKYFVCERRTASSPTPSSAPPTSRPADGGAAIVDGNRKVLAARLSDARFFWDQDRKIAARRAREEARADHLPREARHRRRQGRARRQAGRWLVEEGIVKSLPRQREGARRDGRGHRRIRPRQAAPAPTLRLKRRSPRPRSIWPTLAEQAARLAKADLVTEMVGEFPELQGLMGGYYARAEGLPAEVADAIRDHYKPVGQGDDVPTAPVTVAVSLADKLDTLVGFFVDRREADRFARIRSRCAAPRSASSQLVLTNGLRLPLATCSQRRVASFG